MLHRADFPYRAAAGLLLLAAVLRLGTTLSRVDEQNPEELYRGALAQAWVEGAPVWPGEAPQVEHLRGSLLVSALAVPLFAALGPTTFALRQSGLIFHLAGLLLFMLLAHRLFGRRAALLAGALFVLAPPALAKIAALSYGDHMESVPFVCAAALAMYAWLEERRSALLAGLALGLAMSWHAQARLAALVLLAVAVAAAPRRLLGREGGLGLLPGLLLGLMPMAALDAWTARPGWLVFGADPLEQVVEHAGLARGAKWLGFWLTDLPGSLQFPWPLAGPAFCALAALAIGGLAARALRPAAGAPVAATEPERPRLWPRLAFLAGYPLVFSLAYAFSRFAITLGTSNAIQSRFVLPVVPFVLLLPLAVAGARLLEHRRRAAAALLVGPALLLGAAGSLSTWDLDSLAHEPARRAVHWETVARHLQWGALDDSGRAELRALERSLYGDPRQRELTEDFVERHADPCRFVALVMRFDDQPAWTAPLRFELPGLAQPVTPAELASLPRELRPWAAATIGGQAGVARRRSECPSDLAALARLWTDDESLQLSRGYGRGLASVRPQSLDGAAVAARLAAPPPGVDARQAAFGYGLRAGSVVHAFYRPGDRLVTEFTAHADPALLAPFARGVGTGYRWRLLHPGADTSQSPAVARLVALLPPGLEPELRAGLCCDEPLAPEAQEPGPVTADSVR